MISPIKIFCCYAHEDQVLLKQLKTHLMSLQQQGLITVWADTDISPGEDWKIEISKHINSDQIILLLISPDFMASTYCYSEEMTQVLDRHKQGNVCVIPIILRSTYIKGAPFEKLQVLPTNAKPLKKWSNIDDGFLNITEGIYTAIKNLPQKPPLPLKTIAQIKNIQYPSSLMSGIYRLPLLGASSIQAINQPTTPVISAAPQIPLLNLPSYPTNTQPSIQQPPIPQVRMTPVTPLISAGLQSTPLNAPFYPTNNLPLIQTPPVPQPGVVKASSKHPLIFKIIKITLYFIGVFIASFGFLGGAVTFAGPDQKLNNILGGFAFFIGTIALLISTIIFFRKHYYKYHLHYIQYMWFVIVATSCVFAVLFLIFSIPIPPIPKSDLASGTITLYGISLVVIAYLKPSP